MTNHVHEYLKGKAMTDRPKPTGPGWWWASIDGGDPECVSVECDEQGLYVSALDIAQTIDPDAIDLLAPIPDAETCARVAAMEAEVERLRSVIRVVYDAADKAHDRGTSLLDADTNAIRKMGVGLREGAEAVLAVVNAEVTP